MRLKNSKNETGLDWGENIEILTATEEDTKQHTGSTSSINSDGEIEPITEPTAAPTTEIKPGLVVKEGRNGRPPIWSNDYVSSEGLSEEDDVNMTIL